MHFRGPSTCMLYTVISLSNLLHDSHEALPIYLLTVLSCLEESVNTRVDLTQCLSADETSRETALAFPPETARQTEESAA